MKKVFKNLFKKIKKNSVKTQKDVPKTKIFIPYVTGIYGLIRAGGPDKFHEFIDSRHQQFGPIFREFLTEDCVFITDPADMRRVFAMEGKTPEHTYPQSWKLYNTVNKCKRGLFFMDGDEWHHNRRIMNSVLLKESFSYFIKPCKHAADVTTRRLESDSENQEVKNLADVLYQWSVESVTAVLLGKNYGSYCKEIAPLISDVTRVMRDVFATSAVIETYPPKLARRLNLKAWQNFETALTVALHNSNCLAAAILKRYHGGDGVLQRLLKNGLNKDISILIMTDLLLAAGDTSVHTMEWILYLLAKHPEIQKRVYEETSPVNDMKEPPILLKNIVKEALRMYPVAPFLNRRIQADLDIKGYTIKKDTLVVYSMYTTGKNPKYFPQPDKFWPDRWNREINKETKILSYVNADPMASQPFAMGTRSCIGRRMAESLLYITIATILEKFELRLLNTKDIKINMRLVAVPSEPIRLSIHPRT